MEGTLLLALTRKKGESIIIGDDIEVMVISSRGDYVRLGIKAPRSIPVHRKEVYELIVSANKEAAAHKSMPRLSDILKLRAAPKSDTK